MTDTQSPGHEPMKRLIRIDEIKETVMFGTPFSLNTPLELQCDANKTKFSNKNKKHEAKPAPKAISP